MLTLLLMAVSAAEASGDEGLPDCTLAELSHMIDVADSSYREGDRLGLAAATRDVRTIVNCLRTPLDPSSAAEAHFVLGLYHLGAGEEQVASAYLTASRKLGGASFRRLEGLPEDDALRADWSALPTPEPDISLSPARRGTLLVDGTKTREYDAALPFVLQYERNSRVVKSAYIEPGGKLLKYPQLRRTLVAGALASGAAAAGMFAGGAYLADNIETQVVDPDVAEQWVRANNNLVAGAVLTGGISAACVMGYTATYVW